VANASNAEARREINVTVAVDIPDVSASSPLPKDGPIARNASNVAGLITAELPGEGTRLRPGNSGLQRWQQVFHNHGVILAVLDELVKRLVGFLIDQEDEMIEPHSLDQIIKAERFILRLLAVEENGQIGVGIATANGNTVAFGYPVLDLVWFDEDAQGHDKNAQSFLVH
jgi:hypothetical protein